MITMKEWMELVDYKITEGGDYGWQCYGPNAYCLDSWNGVHGKGGYSFSIVFSTKTQKVYEVTMCDYTNDRAYRMIAEDKQKKHLKEATELGVNLNQAWDDVDYVDLEVDDDFFQKALAIRAGEDYSTDVLIPINLPDEVLMFAFKQAHEKNMTFNDFVNQVLRDFIDKVNKGEYTKEEAQQWVVEGNAWPFEKDKDEDKTS
jgi:DNA-binding transcriptional regulator YhcF (GntR family)